MRQLQKVPKCNINLCIDDRIVRIDENVKRVSWAPQEIVFPIRYLAYFKYPVSFYISTEARNSSSVRPRAFIWQKIYEFEEPFCTTEVQYDSTTNTVNFYPRRKEQDDNED